MHEFCNLALLKLTAVLMFDRDTRNKFFSINLKLVDLFYKAAGSYQHACLHLRMLNLYFQLQLL